MALKGKTLRRVGLAMVTLFLGVAGFTLLALESGGVVTVYTAVDDTNIVRRTRVWFVQDDAHGLYLEAGHPDNPWVRDLGSARQIQLSGQGLDGSYDFAIETGPADHRKIRRLMREKYGWRDW